MAISEKSLQTVTHFLFYFLFSVIDIRDTLCHVLIIDLYHTANHGILFYSREQWGSIACSIWKIGALEEVSLEMQIHAANLMSKLIVFCTRAESLSTARSILVIPILTLKLDALQPQRFF